MTRDEVLAHIKVGDDVRALLAEARSFADDPGETLNRPELIHALADALEAAEEARPEYAWNAYKRGWEAGWCAAGKPAAESGGWPPLPVDFERLFAGWRPDGPRDG